MSLRYYHSFDILRLVAVLAVISSHTKLFSAYNSATASVWLFFVLSGFLITGILLVQKEKLQTQNIWQSYKVFFSRRFLRIFPIYYLTLILVRFFFADSFSWGILTKWYFTYLANFHFLIELKKWPGMYSHLWTLSVEEQFYLIWPFVIFLTPKRIMTFVVVAFILLGPTSRFFFYQSGMINKDLWMHVFPVCNFDLLGVGAFLAIKKNFILDLNLQWRRLLYFICIASGSLYIIGFSIEGAEIFKPFLAAIAFSGVLIFSIINDERIRFPFHKQIKYLGKISYGIYLYHNFIYAFIIKIFQKLHKFNHLAFPQKPLFMFIVVTAASILVAHLSWIIIERRLMKYKLSYK